MATDTTSGTISATLAFDIAADLGEGPHYSPSDDYLYCCDIKGHEVLRIRLSDGEVEKTKVDSSVGCIVTVSSTSASGPSTHPQYTLAATGQVHTLVDIGSGQVKSGGGALKVPSGHTNIRFNDGKCDSRGRLVVGTMEDPGERPIGHLYSYVDGVRTVLLERVTISNGLAWTADETILYYIDSPLRSVRAFDYDINTGGISNPRTVLDFSSDTSCVPDGMTIDARGYLWVCFWDGWRVDCYDPYTAQVIATVRLPCARVTSCVFAGPELDILYITTAAHGLTPAQREEQPLAGAVFQVKVAGARGRHASYHYVCPSLLSAR